MIRALFQLSILCTFNDLDDSRWFGGEQCCSKPELCWVLFESGSLSALFGVSVLGFVLTDISVCQKAQFEMYSNHMSRSFVKLIVVN